MVSLRPAWTSFRNKKKTEREKVLNLPETKRRRKKSERKAPLAYHTCKEFLKN
jgi:hypothetical protein